MRKPRLRDIEENSPFDLGNQSKSGGWQSWDSNHSPSDTQAHSQEKLSAGDSAHSEPKALSLTGTLGRVQCLGWAG